MNTSVELTELTPIYIALSIVMSLLVGACLLCAAGGYVYSRRQHCRDNMSRHAARFAALPPPSPPPSVVLDMNNYYEELGGLIKPSVKR